MACLQEAEHVEEMRGDFQRQEKSGWSFLARSGLGVHLETGAGEVLIMEVPKGHKKD